MIKTRFVKKLSFFTLPIIVLLSIPSLAAQAWQKCQGPEGGAVFCVYEHKANLYAGTYGGGIFKSSDSGRTWAESNKGLLSLIVSNICSVGDTLFAGTWGYGICRSVDNGGTWERVFYDSLSEPYTEIKALAAIDSTLFAVTKYGNFLRSTTLGVTWQSLNMSGLPSDTLFLRFYNQRAFVRLGQYIYTASDYGVARTSDNGSSWEFMNNGITDKRLYSIAHDGMRLYVGSYSEGIYISDDNGVSWNQSTNGLPYLDISWFKGIPMINDIKIDSNGTLYAGTGGGLYYSNNRGINWQKISIDSAPAPSVNSVLIASFGAPFVATLENGVYRINGFSSATSCNKGFFANTITSLVNLNGELAATTWYRGIFTTSDNGGTWENLCNSVVPKLLFQDGSSVLLSDSKGIYRSKDSTKTWTTINKGIADSGWANIVSFVRVGKYLFAGGEGGVWRLTDGDSIWKHLAKDTLIGTCRVGSNMSRLFCASAVGFWASDDSGSTWIRKINPSIYGYFSAIAFNGNHVYAALNNSGVFRSVNNGNTWLEPDTLLPYIKALVCNDSRIFAGTNGGGVFVSIDSGAHWKECNDGLQSLNITALACKDSILFAGTAGSGIFKLDIYGKNSIHNQGRMHGIQDKMKFSIKTLNNTHQLITFQLAEAGAITLSIISLNGKTVYNVIDGFYSSGRHSVPFRSPKIAKGAYFLSLKSAKSQIQSKPFFYVK